MTKTSQTICTHRDRILLNALYLTPLTIDQVVTLSQSWPEPFRNWKTAYRRLQALQRAGWLRSWRYAVESRGSAPSYYRLSLTGYRLLAGSHIARPPTNWPLIRLSPAVHVHTLALSQFIVCLLLAAQRHGIAVCDCHPENTLSISSEEPALFPDFAFTLVTGSGHRFRFFVELDNGTESIVSRTNRDSITSKMRRYEEYHYRTSDSFRVLFVTTRGQERANHIIEAAVENVLERRRSIFYAATLDEALRAGNVLIDRMFVDQQHRRIPLVPVYHPAARGPIEIGHDFLAHTYALA